MNAPFPQQLTSGGLRIRTLVLSRQKALPTAGLAGIAGLAAALRFANLGALGYANHYYAAAVASMLQSWHNFFFVAAEPGAAVTVDKPPVGLWVQTVSAYVFGVNGFSLLLPQILAGILSVILLYHLVRRWFGTAAGLVAALALAVTPVVVATDRNNTMDSTLILTLLLAAWAFVKATESGKLRFLLLGAALVGVGFNIKMLEAYLPLPAFYALYFFGAKERLWRKLPNIALATVVLLAVSLSWALAVDLTPADQRPYVGSSGNNSVVNLMLGYNGMERLNGMGGRGGLLSALFGGNQAGQNRGFPQPGPNASPPQPAANGGAFPRPSAGGLPPQIGASRQPGPAGSDRPGLAGGVGQPGANSGVPQQGAIGGPRQRGAAGGFPQGANGPFPGGGPPPARAGFGGGFGGSGQAGPLRLFTAPLGKEASWLLPFGLFGVALLAALTRPRWPVGLRHQAMLLWGGWLLAGAAFFSVAGFFHEYYLSILGAPLAALAGIGAVELWRLRAQHRWLGIGPLLVAAGVTLGLQVFIAQAFVGMLWWLGISVGLFAVGALLWLAAALPRLRRVSIAGFACIIAALLVTPGIWSALTMLNSSSNQSLPAAYGGRRSGPVDRGALRLNQGLLDYLQSSTQGVKYLMAVPSAMQGVDYVLATGRPVLYLGGFMGRDKVASGEDLARMVAEGELRYVYWNGDARGGQAGQTDVSSWVSANCVTVPGFDAQTQNAGAPDGTTPGQLGGTNAGPGGPGNMRVTLYDCAAAKT